MWQREIEESSARGRERERETERKRCKLRCDIDGANLMVWSILVCKQTENEFITIFDCWIFRMSVRLDESGCLEHVPRYVLISRARLSAAVVVQQGNNCFDRFLLILLLQLYFICRICNWNVTMCPFPPVLLPFYHPPPSPSSFRLRSDHSKFAVMHLHFTQMNAHSGNVFGCKWNECLRRI